MPDFVLNYECSLESLLSLHSSFITVSGLQSETQTSPSEKTTLFELKNSSMPLAFRYSRLRLYTIGHVFFSEAVFLKNQARGQSFSGSSLLRKRLCFVETVIDLRKSAKARFQAIGRKTRMMAKGHRRYLRVFIVFVFKSNYAQPTFNFQFSIFNFPDAYDNIDSAALQRDADDTELHVPAVQRRPPQEGVEGYRIPLLYHARRPGA